jgi:hypothetical protein
MEIIKSTLGLESPPYYFWGILPPPVIARVWYLRSEYQFEMEEQPYILNVHVYGRFVACIPKRAFLIHFSQIDLTSASRSYKGMLWEHKALKLLPNIVFEVDCGFGKSRLGAVVDISESGFDLSLRSLFAWGNGVVILSNEPLAFIKRLADEWVTTSLKTSLAFDYKKVAASLRQTPTVGILQSFPPSSTLAESMAIVAHESFINESTCAQLDSITADALAAYKAEKAATELLRIAAQKRLTQGGMPSLPPGYREGGSL